MKFLSILMLLFATPTYSSDCTDFSGKYRWSSGTSQIEVTTQQGDCARVDAQYDWGNGSLLPRQFIMDGVARPVLEGDDFVSFETHRWVDGSIQIDTETRWKNERYFSTGKLSRDVSGNLIETTITLDQNGQPTHEGSTVYVKQ